MKVCKIVDEYRDNDIVAYLFYYERSKAHTIELSEEITVEDSNIFFEGFVRRGIYTIDPEFSRRWVESRVIPRDRQNIGEILRENGLKEYDSFKLLILAEGRCAQDELAVFQIRENQLPLWVQERRLRKLDFVAPLDPWVLVLVYADGTIWRVDAEDIMKQTARTRHITSRPDKHGSAHLMAGGSGVEWEHGTFLTADELRGHGTKLPLGRNELDMLVRSYVVDSSDVSYELGCSRQYVSKLVRESNLEEFKSTSSSRLFARSELDRIKD